MYIYMYIYVYTHTHIYYIYIHIYRFLRDCRPYRSPCYNCSPLLQPLLQLQPLSITAAP